LKIFILRTKCLKAKCEVPRLHPAQLPFMANIYLTVPFPEKDAAKSLGAKWDGVQRQWYVPDGRDLAPFVTWLPAGAVTGTAAQSTGLTAFPTGSKELSVHKRGVSLSQLLAGVSQAVAQAYKAGVWTMVEVVELRMSSGHVFIGVSERDTHGAVLAKTSAVIWQSTANTILPEFERATGAQLAAGIKLLVRARPVFKPQHGFSLEIDAIDSEYTLGDLEARKREIRERLQSEGVFAVNKQLPSPWDFTAVLVVAPEGGAGLGDFQAEANRLEQWGVCRFTYAFSRFQGEGAAREICNALQAALQTWPSDAQGAPDAVVIIRGGGAVNDLAWLNDYDLARFICDLPIPVLTGIGHERDSTVLDEVANIKFDTPSKVIAGIEQTVVKRVTEVKANFAQVTTRASKAVQSCKAKVSALEVAVRSDAVRHLAQGRQATSELLANVRIDAMQSIRIASEQSLETLQQVKSEARTQMADARRHVPLFWNQIALDTKHALRVAATRTDSFIGAVSTAARFTVRDSAGRAEALMREIAGQGPEKTLSRGFAVVRGQGGKTVTGAAQVIDGGEIQIQFHDGKVQAIADKHL
jgi:exodeoxyribonuclease VII large subunit